MTDNRITIPDRHQEFCKAVARVCREHDVRKFQGTYTPPLSDEWSGDITMAWEQGRHGEDSDKLHINSTIRVWTLVGDATKPEPEAIR